MKLFFTAFFILVAFVIEPGPSETPVYPDPINSEASEDSLRIVALNHFWKELAESVRKGDLQKYSSGYHEDAVVVFGEMKSVPIDVALNMWKQGFIDTKKGLVESDVEFRFSKRIGDETTAFEEGMFKFSVKDEKGEVQNFYSDMNALMIKKNDRWLCLMEYQITSTEEKWNNLEKS